MVLVGCNTKLGGAFTNHSASRELSLLLPVPIQRRLGIPRVTCATLRETRSGCRARSILAPTRSLATSSGSADTRG